MKNKNIIFFILSIVLIISVIIFNYKMDYYELDGKLNPSFDIKKYDNLDNYFLALKKYSSFKFNKVIIGGSTASGLFGNPIELTENKIALLAIPNLSISEQKELLKVFLELHPECKTLILPVSYPNFYTKNSNFLNKYNSNRLTFKEFVSLYLSMDITSKNIKKIIYQVKDKFNNNNDNINNNNNNEREIGEFVTIFPKMTYEVDLFDDDSFNHLKEISKMCKEKNVEIICLIEPLHMYYISQIYKNNKFNEIKKVKIFLVNEFENVLDFSIFNEINEINILENYLFSDVIHPSTFYGKIVFDVILEKNNNEIYKNLYIKLNKKNIDKHIIDFEKNIIKYSNNNKDEIETYLNYRDLEYHEKASFTKTNYLKNMPKNLKKYFYDIDFK